MHKKIIGFLLVILCCFSLYACDGSSSSEANDTYDDAISSEASVLDTNEELGLRGSCRKVKWDCEIKLDKIVDFSTYAHQNYFIDIDGSLYQYTDNGQLFSNDKNYKKISDDKFVRFLRYSAITSNNKIGNMENGRVEFYPNGINCYVIQEVLDKNPSLITFSYGNFPLCYVRNKEVYAVRSNLSDIYDDTLIGVLQSDEEFIGGYGNVIKTDKNYYYSDIVNQDELDKYVDAERKYGFLRMDAVSDAYDEIQYYNGNMIIFKDDNEHIYYLQ